MVERGNKLTNILKIGKKDYNNYLEEILAKKNFQEETKNLLLDILYKVEISYKDYETVKKNVMSQDEYIQSIINIVKNKCDSIGFMKIKNIKTINSIINKSENQILCYPTPINLLYCLAKIQKFDDIVKQEPEIINIALTNTINTGNNINTVEPLRDFNGYSWSITTSEIQNFYHNLIYQDLIILVGNKILEEWTNKNDGMVDYIDIFKEDLNKKYGAEIENDIMEFLKNISILLEISLDKNFKEKVIEQKLKIQEELEKMNNKEKYLDDLSKQKREIVKDIKKIDIILSNKDKLSEEYKKRNEILPLEEKIFSKRVLASNLKKEREEKIRILKQYTYKMNSKNFLQIQENLNYELKYLKLVEIEKLKTETLLQLVKLQKTVLEALRIKIQKASSKEELLKIFYEIRYFKLIPIDDKKNIGNIAKLKKKFECIEEEAIAKAHKLNLLNQISSDRELDIGILRNIFFLNIIEIEKIYLKINKKDNYIQFFDDKIEDKIFQMDFTEKNIKNNKRIKLFNI